ncbi:MAG: flavin reductase family protein [Clostridia bacterium]|jgi:flavin reductase (DIM6/NTAB) family NADH-FMN oxidoreductase RutF|nr:flavin reductase family protein [Clostridia bacterium]
MKKNIGPVMGLYPTVVAVVGTEIEGKVNWINIAHLGVMGVDTMMLSMAKSHYSNIGIKENRTLSISLVNEEMLVKTDYVGIVSGKRVDKSDVFEYFKGELEGAPLINMAPVTMECEVIENFETSSHDNFVVKAVNTYADEGVLNEEGKIDYEKVKPVLFEMPNRQYLSIDKAIAKCWDEGKKYNN